LTLTAVVVSDGLRSGVNGADDLMACDLASTALMI
jgi:hypothetical protein